MFCFGCVKACRLANDVDSLQFVGPTMLLEIKRNGFASAQSIRMDQLKFYSALRKYDAVVLPYQKYSRELVLLSVFDIIRGSDLKTHERAVNILPQDLWTLEGSPFDIISSFSTRLLLNMGVLKENVAKAQGALLQLKVFSVKDFSYKPVIDRYFLVRNYM